MRFEHITSDITPLDPVDDRRHRLRPESLARESLVFTLQLPEQGIAGFVYPRVGADGIAAGVMCVFGEGVPGGAIFEQLKETPVPEQMDFTDWQVGDCSVKLDGGSDTSSYGAGTHFDVPANSGFDIEVAAGICEYVCSFLD